MPSIKKWLTGVTAKGEAISHWATTLGFAAALFGGYLAYGQLTAANAQLEQANEQRRWQNYNDMNIRYAELYHKVPEEIATGCSPKNFADLSPEARRWVRQYIDLYSEEYWLYKNNLIPHEMWTRRIHGGVRVNLSKYPAIVDGYHYWKRAGSFTHPDDFQQEVERAIKDANSPPYATKANKNRGCVLHRSP